MKSVNKISRICWNTNGWKKPSGIKGKSRHNDAFENSTGFGVEEWLFDTSKQIDGYCYGYLRAIASKKNKNEYHNINLNISLYTIENESHFSQRYWVGEIKNVEVIDDNESQQIYEIYKKKGWLDLMYQQLDEIGAIADNLNKDDLYLCLKYKPENLFLEKKLIPFEKSDGIVNADYYNNLFNFNKKPNKEFTYDIGDEEQEQLKVIENSNKLVQVEKEQLIKARIGQGYFRTQLLNMYKKCMVTGIDFKEILIASHIKPWAKSDNREKLDKYNGLLLSADIDALFDGGYISFDDKGKVMISNRLKEHKLPDLNFKIELHHNSKEYMKYHRNNIFKKD